MKVPSPLKYVDVAQGSPNTSKISVVVPAYNASKYLRAALQSVFDQSSQPGEIIVVDDGSTDDTSTIARSFGVRLISQSNGGVSAARNAGMFAASGEYIALLDADDIWAPTKLQAQLAALEADARAAFCFTDYCLLDESGNAQSRSELRRSWGFRRAAGRQLNKDRINIGINTSVPALYDSYIPPSSVLFRRSDALAIGGFDESLKHTEDYDFHLRLLRNSTAVAVMEPLLLYRKHPGQATAAGADMKSGFFAVATRVAASPERYPSGEARYISRTEYLRFYRLGLQHSRIGNFGDAVSSFERSLNGRWTASAALALLGCRICLSNIGRAVFDITRTAWKMRPRGQ